MTSGCAYSSASLLHDQGKLQEAQAEVEAKAKMREAVALEAKLREAHLALTGRRLPCRLPHYLEQQTQRVHDPELRRGVLLEWDDMLRLLAELSITYDVRGLRALFGALSKVCRSAPA